MPIPLEREKYEHAAQRIVNGAWRVDARAGVVYGNWGNPIGHRHSQGYTIMALRLGDRTPNVFAHRVVWEHVHGPIADGLYINHINGDKADNRICNLEAVTVQANADHARRTGLTRDVGAENSRAVLTSEQATEIRRLTLDDPTISSSQMALRFGVSQGVAVRVMSGRSYGAVEKNELPAVECENCGELFPAKMRSGKYGPKRYCSADCQSIGWRSRRREPVAA